MSVFRSMSTKITDEGCLVKGLKVLGYNPSVGANQEVRGHGYEKFKGDVVLKKEDTGHKGDIGFQKMADGTYNLVYDTWLFKLKNEEFIGQVSQQHAKFKVAKIAAQQGLELQQTTTKDGVIRAKYVKVGV